MKRKQKLYRVRESSKLILGQCDSNSMTVSGPCLPIPSSFCPTFSHSIIFPVSYSSSRKCSSIRHSSSPPAMTLHGALLSGDPELVLPESNCFATFMRPPKPDCALLSHLALGFFIAFLAAIGAFISTLLFLIFRECPRLPSHKLHTCGFGHASCSKCG